VVRVHKFSLLIDAGPAIVKLLQRARQPLPSVIALTHRHRDAAGGLLGLARFPSFSPTLWVPPKERKYFVRLSMRGWDVRNWKAHKLFLRQPLKVLAFPVIHVPRSTFSTWGFRIQADGKTVTYASDFKSIPPASRKYFQKNDLLIVDGAGWQHDLATHRGILNHARAYAAQNKRVLFTQIGRLVPPHNQANRILQKICPRAALAYDGLRIKL
jgi:phosphoribosyl 1,2-cyclic phosphodiesterase